MNREIKFRAWELPDGMGSNGHMFDPSEVGDHTLNDLEDMPWVLMQYTGFKDKNGKEIYEGDACQVVDHTGVVDEFSVVWCAKTAKFTKDRGILGFSFAKYMKMNDIMTVEVIGNIHENPELCEK